MLKSPLSESTSLIGSGLTLYVQKLLHLLHGNISYRYAYSSTYSGLKSAYVKLIAMKSKSPE